MREAIDDMDRFETTQALLEEIEEELERARAKFPGDNVTFAALVEEVGELAKATFEEPRANVRKEAVQVAVMAMRMVLDGDHTFEAWRASKGLDPLIDRETALEGSPE
jgi:NTP pyrophosphatase (non-canonical NTP hydrolase)